MSNDITAAASDGYSVIISSSALEARAKQISKTAGDQNDLQAEQSLRGALVPPGAFGNIPGGQSAAQRLATSVNEHLTAIGQMGVSLTDFAARVQAAGELAEQGEGDTTKFSYVAPPFNSGNG